MKSHATKDFWLLYQNLPPRIRKLAVKQYRLWIDDQQHPSVRFKKVGGSYWSARITNDYRALGTVVDDTVVWFWIGTHAQYDRLLKG